MLDLQKCAKYISIHKYIHIYIQYIYKAGPFFKLFLVQKISGDMDHRQFLHDWHLLLTMKVLERGKATVV